jgi:hypothetical protein
VVTLCWPIDSLVMPRGTAGARPQMPVALAQATEAEPSPPVAPPPPPPVPAPPGSRVELTVRLAREAVRVALRVARVPQSRARLASIGSRIRLAALAPDLRVRGGRTTDESLRWTPTDADPYRYNQAGDTRLYLEVELGWKLGRLVFDDAEFRVEELRRQRAKAEHELVQQVLRALFEWQKARLRSVDPELSENERVEAWIVMIRAASELDLLTDGWFERHTRRAPDSR